MIVRTFFLVRRLETDCLYGLFLCTAVFLLITLVLLNGAYLLIAACLLFFMYEHCLISFSRFFSDLNCNSCHCFSN